MHWRMSRQPPAHAPCLPQAFPIPWAQLGGDGGEFGAPPAPPTQPAVTPSPPGCAQHPGVPLSEPDPLGHGLAWGSRCGRPTEGHGGEHPLGQPGSREAEGGSCTSSSIARAAAGGGRCSNAPCGAGRGCSAQAWLPADGRTCLRRAGGSLKGRALLSSCPPRNPPPPPLNPSQPAAELAVKDTAR